MASSDDIKIVLKRSPEDAKQFSQEYQETIRVVLGAFKAEGIKTVPRLFTMDSVDAGGGYTGEFIAAAKIIGPVAVAALKVWLASRNGRQIKVKIGDIEAEVNSVKQLDEVLEKIAKFKGENEPKRIHE